MWIFSAQNKQILPTLEQALPGRPTPINTSSHHAVTGRALKGPHPKESERILFAMGCFWGAERLFWQTEGVISTAVGYAGGWTANPTYQEVCTGQTGHTEVVEVIYNPSMERLKTLLSLFWERHDPTQGMRQGNDIGTQYRSAIYWETQTQRSLIEQSVQHFKTCLADGEHQATGTELTTTIEAMPLFYYAEAEHQQYLYKNPNGYCGLKGTGIQCVWN